MQSRLYKSIYGNLHDGTRIEAYELRNGAGLIARIMSRGATLLEMHTPDRAGAVADITLGYDTLEGWLRDENPYFGSIVGRYASRIAEGKFNLDGKNFTVPANDGRNSLHGGYKGFDKAIWKAEAVSVPDGVAVHFAHVSPDGDEGYPGTLRVSVVYTLTEANELRLDYEADTDQPTVSNLTNHTYWNLKSEGNVYDHILGLNASKITAVDESGIPTGELIEVTGTPWDFVKPKTIGSLIAQVESTPRGYDHNYIIEGSGGADPLLAARVEDPVSGRVMELLTTEPGVQFYSRNVLDGTETGKGGRVYAQHAGFVWRRSITRILQITPSFQALYCGRVKCTNKPLFIDFQLSPQRKYPT
jgi:aldose 1-epimerase